MATEERIGYIPSRKPGQASVDVVRDGLRAGMTNKQIARIAGITEGVVKYHCMRIFREVGAANRSQAAIKLRS